MFFRGVWGEKEINDFDMRPYHLLQLMYTTLEGVESLQVLEPMTLVLTYHRAVRTVSFALENIFRSYGLLLECIITLQAEYLNL